MSSIAIVDLLKNLVEDEQEAQILELLSQGISNDELIEKLLEEGVGGESNKC